MRPSLLLAPATYLGDVRADLRAYGVQDAVALQDIWPSFKWLMRLVQLQGISDAVAHGYADQHGQAHYADLRAVGLGGPVPSRV